MPFKEDGGFYFGVNIAWLNRDYDHDLGINSFHPDWGVAYDSELLDAYFRHLGHRGIKVVRFWVFEKLEGMVFSELPGPTMVPHRWSGLPLITHIDSNLINNVRDIMDKAHEHGLEVYWCLLDGSRASTRFPEDTILRKIISNADLRQTFIDNALVPFLVSLAPYRDHVFAVDLINEPEGTRLKWKYIRDYISAASAVVRGEDFKCSVGFREKNTILSHQSDLNSHLDFYDYHAYNSSGKLEQYSSLGLSKPCIVGEFGHKDWLARYLGWLGFAHTVDDAEQNNTDSNFMRNAINRGYKGCLIWRYSPVGDPNRILKVNRDASPGDSPDPAAIQAFISSFLSAAGSTPTVNMDDDDWKAEHERRVWDAIRDFVRNHGPFP